MAQDFVVGPTTGWALHLIPWVKGCTSQLRTAGSQLELATFHDKARLLTVNNTGGQSRLQPPQEARDTQAPHLDKDAWGLL